MNILFVVGMICFGMASIIAETEGDYVRAIDHLLWAIFLILLSMTGGRKR